MQELTPTDIAGGLVQLRRSSIRIPRVRYYFVSLQLIQIFKQKINCHIPASSFSKTSTVAVKSHTPVEFKLETSSHAHIKEISLSNLSHIVHDVLVVLQPHIVIRRPTS